MKNSSLIILVLLFSFTGCDKIKDAASITVPTHLQCSIPVIVTGIGMKSVDLSAGVSAVSFSQTQDLSLAANTDISPYLSKINEINMSSVVVQISGLGAGQTINTLTLEVTGVGTVFTQTNITAANSSFTPVVSTAILNQMGAKLKADKKITFTVSGTASGPMTFTVGLNIDAKVVVFTI